MAHMSGSRNRRCSGDLRACTPDRVMESVVNQLDEAKLRLFLLLLFAFGCSAATVSGTLAALGGSLSA